MLKEQFLSPAFRNAIPVHHNIWERLSHLNFSGLIFRLFVGHEKDENQPLNSEAKLHNLQHDFYYLTKKRQKSLFLLWAAEIEAL